MHPHPATELPEDFESLATHSPQQKSAELQERIDELNEILFPQSIEKACHTGEWEGG